MNKWFLAYKERGDDIFNLDGLTVIDPPEGRYYADPHLLERDGKTYVFFEDYDYKKGIISYSDLHVWDPKPIIEEDYHMSFPHVFEYQGETYMIPETLTPQEIRLYRCVEFPFRWVFDRVLFKGGCFADVTFHQDEQGCYLYTTVGDDNRLWIFFSETLHGEWKLHGENYRSQNRNAGGMFVHNSRLLRPVQDNSKGYGHSIVFRDLWNKNVEVARIEPDWMEGLIGTHTFNMTKEHIIIDGKVEI